MYSSVKLMHALMEHDLVDELRIWVHPVFSGAVGVSSTRESRRPSWSSWTRPGFPTASSFSRTSERARVGTSFEESSGGRRAGFRL
jgi:hypothetical protein